MNQKFEAFRDEILSQKTAVLGMNAASVPLIAYLLKLGVDVTVFDKANPDALKNTMEAFRDSSSIHYALGRDYEAHLNGFDRVFITPGIKGNIPELQAAREHGTVITSEMDIFFELCPAELFAVTGSEGKTTTALILQKLLSEAGFNCHLAGQIGTPLLSQLEHITEQDKVVLELSSFQLNAMSRSPHVAVITNLSPNHLDYHGSMQDYMEAKKSIYQYQNAHDRLILNYDNDLTRELGAQAPSRVTFFSRKHPLSNGIVVQNGHICAVNDGESVELLDCEQIRLPGDHNLENYLAAIASASEYAKPEVILKTASALTLIPHRLEFVRELGGVRYYNDSAASSPTRTSASLSAFDQRVILIAGGYDQRIPFTPMAETLIRKARHLILTGQTASMIEMALMKSLKGRNAYTDIRITTCSDLEQAVYSAYFSAKPGDIVVLSPASPQANAFRGYEEIGSLFRTIVNDLPAKKA